MFLTIIGAIVLAVAIAGVVQLAYRLAGRKPPRGTLPLAAGVALIIFFIWNDYSWYKRTADELPESVKVARAYPSTSKLQPWTYVKPHVTRFAAVDTATLKRNDAQPGYVLADIFLVERYVPTIKTVQLYDCDGGRRTDILETTEMGEDGLPANAQWYDLDADDAFRPLICGGNSG